MIVGMIFVDSSDTLTKACDQEGWHYNGPTSVTINGTPRVVWDGTVEKVLRCSTSATFLWESDAKSKPSDRLVDAEKVLQQREIKINYIEVKNRVETERERVMCAWENFRTTLVRSPFMGQQREFADAIRVMDGLLSQSDGYGRYNSKLDYTQAPIAPMRARDIVYGGALSVQDKQLAGHMNEYYASVVKYQNSMIKRGNIQSTIRGKLTEE